MAQTTQMGVKGPDGKTYQFPKDATDEEIVAFFQEQETTPTKGRDLGGTYRGVGRGLFNSAANTLIGAADVATSAARNLMPTTMREATDRGFAAARGMVASEGQAEHTGQIAGDIAQTLVPVGRITKTATAAAEALPYALRYLARPVRGLVEGAGAATIANIQGSDPTVAGLLGGTTGAVLGGKLTPAMGRGNAVTREAVDFAERRGIPLDAGTVTGNPVVRGTQYIADRTIPGSIVAGKATEGQQAALANTGRQLAREADPRGASTPLSAGQAVRDKVSGEVTRLHTEASQHYDALRALEPAHEVDVIVGYKPSPSGLMKDAQPIIERMAFPVDMKPVKVALRGIWDRMRRQMPVTQQQASLGLKAIENIMTGADVAPASIVDLDLSAIKAIARQADRPELRDIGQGLAANAVTQLDAAVQRAVARGGPNATKALMEGRKATRAKYLVNEVLDEISAEPVRAFNMATAPRDTAIAKLRDLKRIAPDEIPKVGRAYLDDLMDTATREGGFTKAGTVLAKWQNLGQETKNMLFSPQMQAELNRFFILAKRAAENPNPSGTAGVSALGAQGAWAVLDPISAATGQGAAWILSKMLRSPKGIRLLADGLKVNPNTVTAQAWKASVLALLNQGEK